MARRCSLRQLHGGLQVAGVLVGDADDSRPQLAVETRTQRHGRAVRADGHVVAWPNAVRAGVVGRELDLGLRTLELQLRRALDSGPREKRPVTHQPQTRAAVPSGSGAFVA